ncbi:MAG: V-type ATPase subunit [Candidatus Woesearchaeota archaeon]
MKTKTIRLQFNPYTYVRSAVMRSMLLDKEAYETLIKMGPEEMITYLQARGYAELAQLRVQYQGIELVEQAVKQNIVNTFRKLRRISDDDLRTVLDIYLKRYDVRNIKTVLRGLMFNQPVLSWIIPAGRYPLEFYEEMLKKKDIKEALAMLRGESFEFLAKVYEEGKKNEFEKTNVLFYLETKLDQEYYQYVFEQAKKVKNDAGIIKEFMQEEIRAKNIITLFKIKKMKKSGDTALFSSLKENNFFLPHTEDNLFNHLLKLQTEEAIIAALRKSHYKTKLDEGIAAYQQTGSLIQLEKNLRIALLERRKRSAFQNLLSVEVILNYLFEKDHEGKNIIMLYKAKVLGFPESVIKQQLIA